MTAEYLIHFPDGTTDGPYTEEDLLDMVDADELSAGAVCEDIATGKRMRVRQLFQVIPPAAASSAPPPEAGHNGSDGRPSAAAPAAAPGPPAKAPSAAPARWIPAPLPESMPTASKPAAAREPGPAPRAAPPPPPPRTYYSGSPSLLSYPLSLVLAFALTAGGWYAGRWDGNYLATGWLAGFSLLALVMLLRSASDYRVTSRRVEARIGLLSKSSKEIRISDIRSINVTKSGMKGLLGVGTVIFSSSGGTEEDVTFRQIWRAHRVKDLVRLLQDRPG